MTLLKPTVGRVLGWLTLTSLVVLALFGLWGAPPDDVQGDAQRLMYLHVPAAWVAYLAFAVTSLSSALWLWQRTRSPVWDRIAGASAELGVMFTGLTLVIGSLWGRPVWGVWWAWDARMTSVLILLFLYLGYMALWNAIEEPVRAAKAVAARSSVQMMIPAWTGVIRCRHDGSPVRGGEGQHVAVGDLAIVPTGIPGRQHVMAQAAQLLHDMPIEVLIAVQPGHGRQSASLSRRACSISSGCCA